jgi:pimeloyl-ACP methyl ester carboxylesterase
MSAILLNDRIVHYEVIGRGRPIIFLHGWVGSWRYWVPAMQSAATSFRAYAIDLWGFGDSAHDPERYALEGQTALLDAFLNELGIAKVALVGHGLGGLAGILFARKSPEMVDRMMMVGIPLQNEAINNRLRSPASPADLAEWLLGKDPLTAPAREDAPKADLQAITRSLDSMSIANFLPLVDAIATPCLIVHGESDPAILAPDIDRTLSLPERVHDIILEECGHFPMLDESARFNRLMSDFLALESGESPRQLQLKEEWKRRVR